MNTTFVYQPRSGRTIYNYPSTKLVLVQWANGCCHVVGGYHLAWNAAYSGKWHRDDAIRSLREVASIHGGYVWDDRGDVHIITPREGVTLFMDHVQALLPDADYTEVLQSAWRAGCATLGAYQFSLVTDLPRELDAKFITVTPSTAVIAWSDATTTAVIYREQTVTAIDAWESVIVRGVSTADMAVQTPESVKTDGTT